jgi:hypothetical protein
VPVPRQNGANRTKGEHQGTAAAHLQYNTIERALFPRRVVLLTKVRIEDFLKAMKDDGHPLEPILESVLIHATTLQMIYNNEFAKRRWWWPFRRAERQ